MLVSYNQLYRVLDAIEYGVSLEARDKEKGHTAMMEAAIWNNLDMLDGDEDLGERFKKLSALGLDDDGAEGEEMGEGLDDVWLASLP